MSYGFFGIYNSSDEYAIVNRNKRVLVKGYGQCIWELKHLTAPEEKWPVKKPIKPSILAKVGFNASLKVFLYLAKLRIEQNF